MAGVMGGESRTKLSRIVGRVDRLLGRSRGERPWPSTFFRAVSFRRRSLRVCARRVRSARPARHHRHRRGAGRRKRRRAQPSTLRPTWPTPRTPRTRPRTRAAGRRLRRGPFVNCRSCVGQSCGPQVLTCVISTTCRTALQCVVTTCLSGGTPISRASRAAPTGTRRRCRISSASSRASSRSCGSQCTSVLGGLWRWGRRRRRRSRGWRRRGLRVVASHRCWGQLLGACPRRALRASRRTQATLRARGPAALRRRREGRGREPLGGRARQAAPRRRR